MVNNLEEYIKQGEVLYSIGKFEEAKEKYKRALKEDSMNVDTYFKLSEAYTMLDDYEKAQKCMNNVLLISKDNPKAYFYLGNIAFLNDDIELGKGYYLKAMHFGFSDIAVFVNYATVCESQGNYEEALKYYNKAILKDSFRADIRFRKAQILTSMNKYEEALEALDVFIELEPEVFDGYHLKFLILLETKRIEEAECILNKAIELFPEDQAFLFDKILLLKEKQDVDAALDIIENKFKDSENSLILKEKAKIYLTKNDLDKAKEIFSRVSSVQESFDEESRMSLIIINMAQSNFAEAMKLVEEIIINKSEGIYYYTALYIKGQIIKKQEGELNSQIYYKSIISLFRNASIENMARLELILYRGFIYKEVKDYERAIEMAEYLLAISEDFAEAYLLKASVYEAKGELEKSNLNRKIALSKNASLNDLGLYEVN